MDPRIIKLAKILTDYSVKIKKDDKIRVTFEVQAKDLALEIYKNILKKGAYPIMHPAVSGFTYAYYNNASDEQLKSFPQLTDYEVKHCDGFINIMADHNTKELSNIEPKKMAMRSKSVEKISDYIVNTQNWCIVAFPTESLAQDAEMSLEEFEDFIYSSTNIEWSEQSKKQDKFKKMLDDGKQVRIIGKNTDLTFSIDGRQAIKCDGRYNMPDGEVFIAPDEYTADGFIEYSFPVIYHGKEVKGIKLKFEKGKVVEAKAEKNEDLLNAMIEMDDGASRIGEFGIGLNFGIKKFVRQILFDEKIGGTIHLALGKAYKEGGGKNESALHWDMIKDLRKEGKIIIDGKVVMENGEFKV